MPSATTSCCAARNLGKRSSKNRLAGLVRSLSWLDSDIGSIVPRGCAPERRPKAPLLGLPGTAGGVRA